MRRPTTLLAVLVASVAALLGVGAPAGAQAAGKVELRLAHLSPDTPAMDVYVAGADGKQALVLPGISYGQVSGYLELEPGPHTFALRRQGTAADSPAAITASAQLGAAGAYTIAAIGKRAAVRTTLYADDLSAPAAGEARLRIINAASTTPSVDIRVVGGGPLVAGATFGSASGYATVPAGTWQLSVAPTSGGTASVQTLTVAAGTVSSVVVLDGAGGSGLRLSAVVDASGVTGAVPAAPAITAVPAPDATPAATVAPAAPAGGVATGLGGMAPDPGRSWAPPASVVAGGLVVLLGATGAVRGRRATVAVPARVRRR